MNFNDPILQQDGTLLTRIDVALLKLAKVVAAPFRDEAEECYTPAMKRMLFFGGIYFLAIGLTFTVLFANPTALLLPAVPAAAAILLSQLRQVRCSKTGTVMEKQSDKLLALVSLQMTPLFVGLLVTALHARGVTTSTVEIYLVMLGAGITYLAFIASYVTRLGEPPRKRERAKVLKPALHH